VGGGREHIGVRRLILAGDERRAASRRRVWSWAGSLVVRAAGHAAPPRPHAKLHTASDLVGAATRRGTARQAASAPHPCPVRPRARLPCDHRGRDIAPA